MANDLTRHEPLSDERLAEIRATLSDEEGMSDLAYRFTSAWASVRFKGDLAQAAIDLLGEVERLQAERAQVREAALTEVQEFVVSHRFDTTVGRKIDDFITAQLNATQE